MKRLTCYHCGATGNGAIVRIDGEARFLCDRHMAVSLRWLRFQRP